MRLLYVILMAALMAFPVNGYVLSLNEEEYGQNIIRIQREAQVLWVRENVQVIYDYIGRKNKYVNMLSDEEIMHIIRSEASRELLGIDEVDLEPYMERVKEMEASEKEASEAQPAPRELDEREIVERPPEQEETRHIIKRLTSKEEIEAQKAIREQQQAHIEEVDVMEVPKEPQIEMPRQIVCLGQIRVRIAPWQRFIGIIPEIIIDSILSRTRILPVC